VEGTGSTDLAPGIYEGGFKVWECSLDLAKFIAGQADEQWRGLTVLEIGCGHGLPGLVALRKGAAVHFQDYNLEVLERVTWPNVRLNVPSVEIGIERRIPRLISGDWSALRSWMVEGQQSYDRIITAETIYSLESMRSLFELIKAVLAPNGIAYVAAKTYYFGVGGSTLKFKQLVRNCGFECTEVAVVRDGTSNFREILCILRPQTAFAAVVAGGVGVTM